jgi:hypothetical protein
MPLRPIAAAAGTAAMSTGARTRAHGGQRYSSRVTSRFGALLHIRAGHSEGKSTAQGDKLREQDVARPVAAF